VVQLRSGKGSGCAQIGLGGRSWDFAALSVVRGTMRSRSAERPAPVMARL
jgi:hypothetical protein